MRMWQPVAWPCSLGPRDTVTGLSHSPVLFHRLSLLRVGQTREGGGEPCSRWGRGTDRPRLCGAGRGVCGRAQTGPRARDATAPAVCKAHEAVRADLALRDACECARALRVSERASVGPLLSSVSTERTRAAGRRLALAGPVQEGQGPRERARTHRLCVLRDLGQAAPDPGQDLKGGLVGLLLCLRPPVACRHCEGRERYTKGREKGCCAGLSARTVRGVVCGAGGPPPNASLRWSSALVHGRRGAGQCALVKS